MMEFGLKISRMLNLCEMIISKKKSDNFPNYSTLFVFPLFTLSCSKFILIRFVCTICLNQYTRCAKIQLKVKTVNLVNIKSIVKRDYSDKI